MLWRRLLNESAPEDFSKASIIRGHHNICKSIWTPGIGKQLLVCRDEDYAHDRYVVFIKIGGRALVRHVPWERSHAFHCIQSSLCSWGGQMTCHLSHTNAWRKVEVEMKMGEGGISQMPNIYTCILLGGRITGWGCIGSILRYIYTYSVNTFSTSKREQLPNACVYAGNRTSILYSAAYLHIYILNNKLYTHKLTRLFHKCFPSTVLHIFFFLLLESLYSNIKKHSVIQCRRVQLCSVPFRFYIWCPHTAQEILW